MDEPATVPQRPAWPLRPVVGLLGVVLGGLQAAGRLLGLCLESYERGTDAAGRAVVRAGRAVLRSLGPLGRGLRRLAAPPLRLLRRAWQWLGVRVLLRMGRPLRRGSRWVVDRGRPVVARVAQALEALTAPLVSRLVRATDAVEAAAARVGSRARRLLAPVVAAARRLRG